ncbi:MAG: hypothetical protein GY778_11070, partial [bacterium]|nr:hypothetical protein [bacterium]
QGRQIQRWEILGDGLLASWSFELIDVVRAADSRDPSDSGRVDYMALDDPDAFSAPATPPRRYLAGLDLPAELPLTPPAPATGEPSQTPADAERDGVVAELAAIPTGMRVSPLVGVNAEEGRWILARPTDELIRSISGTGCGLGNTVDGTYGVDVICVVEYGEILLVDDLGQIIRAYPMPGAVPSWILVDVDAVYAGRIGDGGLPDNTLVRIDRTSLQADVWLVPAPLDGGSEWPPDWRIASDAQSAQYVSLVSIGPDSDGTQTDSWIGNVR